MKTNPNVSTRHDHITQDFSTRLELAGRQLFSALERAAYLTPTTIAMRAVNVQAMTEADRLLRPILAELEDGRIGVHQWLEKAKRQREGFEARQREYLGILSDPRLTDPEQAASIMGDLMASRLAAEVTHLLISIYTNDPPKAQPRTPDPSGGSRLAD